MDNPPPMPDTPAAVRKEQAQSVSQLQQLDVPAVLSRPPSSRKSSRKASKLTFPIIASLTIGVALVFYFLVRFVAQ